MVFKENDTEEFILTYERFYFAEKYNEEERETILNRASVKSVKDKYEETAVKKLNRGEHDICVIAWKLGDYKKMDEFECNNKITSVRGYELSDYLDNVSKRYNDIKKFVDVGLDQFMKKEYWNAIDTFCKVINILKENAPKKFGNVYFINSLFFISKGAVPIYDKNVFRAVQALYLDEDPDKIKASDAPNSSNSLEAAMRLVEYMLLLDNVFGEYKTKLSDQYCDLEKNYYISRGLDRALWVYGQSQRKNDNKDTSDKWKVNNW